MFSPPGLGIDQHYGHVDRSGLYHYHQLKTDSNVNIKENLVGYAPVGFKIMYKLGESTSWKLIEGLRRTAPGANLMEILKRILNM